MIPMKTGLVLEGGGMRGKMRQMYDLGIADAKALFNNKKD